MMGRWDSGMVGRDGGIVRWWDGGMVGWWDDMVGWWGGGMVGRDSKKVA